MVVSIEHEIPMGHRLMNHKGLCQHPHGHNYRVVAFFEGVVDPSTGMVADFSDLKFMLRSVLEPFDHGFVLHKDDPFQLAMQNYAHRMHLVPFHPTAEELAKFWCEAIKALMINHHGLRGVKEVRVDVYETTKSCASA